MPYSNAANRRSELAALCTSYGIQILYAFGSRAREALGRLDGASDAAFPPGSDLDIGVKAARALGIREKSALASLENQGM